MQYSATSACVLLIGSALDDAVDLDRPQALPSCAAAMPLKHIADVTAAGDIPVLLRVNGVKADIHPHQSGSSQITGMFSQQVPLVVIDRSADAARCLRALQRGRHPLAHQRLTAGDPHLCYAGATATRVKSVISS